VRNNRSLFNAKEQVGQQGSGCLPTRHVESAERLYLVEPKITMKWGFFCVKPTLSACFFGWWKIYLSQSQAVKKTSENRSNSSGVWLLHFEALDSASAKNKM
jgi:hypothetical protein